MTSSGTDKSQIRYARLAGLMYLVVDAAFALGLFVVSRFQVPGNFAETAHKVMASEPLYRLGLSSELMGALCTVLLAMGLYVTTKPIDNNLALLGLVFRVAEATLFGVQALLSFVAVNLFTGADHVSAFDANQLSALLYLRSAGGSAGFNIAAIFFSIGSIFFFYLFCRSSYLPKFLSGFGFVGSLLVPIVCFGSLVSPRYAGILQFGWIPIGVAEIVVGFWLLFKGVKLQPLHSGNQAATS